MENNLGEGTRKERTMLILHFCFRHRADISALNFSGYDIHPKSANYK